MLNYTKIPFHMRDGVKNYIEYGLEPGRFLKAVLENNFVEAVSGADNINQNFLLGWADFLYNELPLSVWGSPEKVKKWIEAKQNGKTKQTS